MSEWISIEDRLPELYYCAVLVAVCPNTSHNQVNVAYRNTDGWHVMDEEGNHADFITHWQPLPEPPKEKE
jgi:hypothetical protein